MKRKLNATILLILLGLIATACSSDQTHSTDQISDKQEGTLRKAPNFEVTTISGDTVSLEQSLKQNKPMVVYFTASWCPICAQNWPVLS